MRISTRKTKHKLVGRRLFTAWASVQNSAVIIPNGGKKMKTERKLLTGTLLALCGALLALCIVLAAGWSKAAKTDAALPEVRNSGTAIQWKYSDEADWHDLVALSELRGAAGEKARMEPTAKTARTESTARMAPTVRTE